MTNSQKNNTAGNDWQLATSLVHGGTLRSQFGETSEACYLTSGYVYNSAEEAEARFKGDAEGYVYSRYSNPTVTMFEERMVAMEGADAARGTSSGMAAISSSMLCMVNAGDHVVSSRALFGSCLYIVENLLPRFGVETTIIDGTDLDAWKNACKPNTKLFFLESPANPTLELIDISAVADIAHNAGAQLIVDNVFATPLLQKPFELGADIVGYSTTKHIDGQGRCLGGVVLGSQEYIEEKLHDFLKHTGPSMSPFNAWVMLKGLETLPVRVQRHVESAEEIAAFLSDQESINYVRYPGRSDHPQYDIAQKQMSAGGNIVAFDMKGDKDRAFRFLNALNIIKISNNLGDAKSLITHPATTTHQRLEPEARAELGISDTLLRISVGLEDINDLKCDIDRALSVSKI